MPTYGVFALKRGVIHRTVLSYMPLTDVLAAPSPPLSSKGGEREIKTEAGWVMLLTGPLRESGPMRGIS